MTDRGTSNDNKRKDQTPSTSSVNKPNKRLKNKSAVPIQIPPRKRPQPIQSTSAKRSRRTKHATNRPTISSSNILDARDRAALKGQATLQRSLTNRVNAISIDDDPTSAPTSSYQLRTDVMLQEIRARKHRIFPRVDPDKMQEKPSPHDGQVEDDDSSKGDSDTDVIDIIKTKKINRVSDSCKSHSDTNAIHIKSDDEGIIQLPSTYTNTSKSTNEIHKPTVTAPLQQKQTYSLSTIKRNDTPKTSLVDSLLSKNASSSSGGFTEINARANPSKSKSSFASNIFSRSSYSGANSCQTQKADKEDDTPGKTDHVHASPKHNRTDISFSFTSTQKTSSFMADDPLLLRSRVQKGVSKKRDTSFSSEGEYAFDAQASVDEIVEELVKKENGLKSNDGLSKRSVLQSPTDRMFKYKAPLSKIEQDNIPSTSSTGMHDFPATNSIASALRSLGRSIAGRVFGTPIEPPKKTRSPSPSPPPIYSSSSSLPPPPPRRRSSNSLIIPYMTRSSNALSLTDPDEEVLVYPFNHKKAVIIKNSDVARVEENRFLNDSIMDAYPKILQDEYPGDQIYTFTSFFFTRLTQPDNNKTSENTELIKYENVKRWTDKINIFEKDYIIIPIEQDLHWFLAIITNPGYCVGRISDDDNDLLISEGFGKAPNPVKKAYITLLDSLGNDRESCYQQICLYLKEEAINRLKMDPLEFKAPMYIKGRAPLQTNLTDCGVHCLYCIKRLYQNPDLVQVALTSPSPSNDHIWEPNLASLFREKLTNIFKDKATEYKAYKKEEQRIKEGTGHF